MRQETGFPLMIYGLLYCFVLFLSRIPYPIARFAGGILGAVFFLIPMGRRRVALSNIMNCFEGQSEKDCREILRRIYIHFGRMIFEVPHILRLRRDNLQKYVTFENEENLRDGLARDKGV